MAETSTGKGFWDNEVVKFLISAGAGFLVDISAYYLFYNNLFKKSNYTLFSFNVQNSTLALAVSFVLGVIVNFLITRYFVFSESKSSPTQQFFRFVLVAIVGFAANLFVLKLFIRVFHMYPPLARITAALSLFFASYFVHKAFSFSLSLRHHAPGKRRPASNLKLLNQQVLL